MKETYRERDRRLRRTHAVIEAIDGMKRDIIDAITGSDEPEDIDAMHEDINGILTDHVADIMHALSAADKEQS